MKNLYIFLLMTLWIFGFGQIKVSEVNLNLNDEGSLYKIFDQQGNKYKLSDIQVGTSKQSKTSKAMLSTNLLCTSGMFELYFETDCGMGGTSAIEIARRNVVCQVFSDISNFINSPLKTNGLNNKVRIFVRNITQIANTPSNALGLATAFYSFPENTAGGIVDNEIWKTIHLGKDSYTNVTSPLLITSNNSNASGVYYHGMMAFNFSSLFSWNTILSSLATGNNHDLYSVALHEVIHSLGFASLINENGQSQFGSNFNYFSRYDTFLKNNIKTQPIIKNSTACSMYNYSFNALLSPTVLYPDCTISDHINSGTSIDATVCGNSIQYVGTNTIPVYTPICYEKGSSLSHFEDQLYPICNPSNNNLYFIMSNANGTGVNKRFLKPEERNALKDIGYSFASTYGNNTIVNSSFKNYFTTISGINVAGINDGIDLNGNLSFVGDLATPITIAGILNNDTNAVSFECLEDLTATIAFPTTLQSLSGTSSTLINFTSSLAGLHLLRYVPVNAQGQKGNITYIYVFLRSANCGIPSACNLVVNGDFEQNLGLPTSSGQMNSLVCGWDNNAQFGSAEYYHSNSNIIGLQIPCNILGSENVNNNSGNAYVGIITEKPVFGPVISESIHTKLATQLLPNISYQVSFDVSLAEDASSQGIKFQIYLSNILLPISSGFGEINNIPNPSMLFTYPSYSTINNGWEKITFTIPARAVAGENYLYIGGLKNIEFVNLTPVIHPVSCPFYTNRIGYYYIDNVSLIPTNVLFNLPSSVCLTQTLSNLNTYITPLIPNGTFSGSGVTLNNGVYSFNSTLAGLGIKTITYTYINNLGCLTNIYAQITVSDCSSTSCPGNLIFDNPQTISSASYQAANSIITNTNYLVNAGSTITLKAGYSITFSPLSEIKAGLTSNFTAQIANCTQTSARNSTKDKPEDFAIDKSNIDVKIYPNPFEKTLTIQLLGDIINNIKVSTLDGKIIYDIQNIQTESYNFDDEILTSGIYIVNIETKSGIIFNKKIIKN